MSGEHVTRAHLDGLRRMYLAAPTNQGYRDLDLLVEPGRATVTVTATPDLHHAAGAVHGAHYFKLLDDAAFFAANSLVPDVFVLTTQFSVQLLAAVVEGRLRASGEVTRGGRSLLYAEAVLLGPDGVALARGHGVFLRSRTSLEDVPHYLSGGV